MGKVTTTKTSLGRLCETLATKDTNYIACIPSTIAEAFKGDQISYLKKVIPEKVDLVISRLLIDSLTFHGIEANQMIVGMLLQTIKTKYWYMNLEEVAFVLQKGMLGFYKTYGKLTAADIMEWIHVYDTTERDEYCETEALKHKESFEKDGWDTKRKESHEFDKAYKQQVKFLKAKKKAKDLND